MTQMKEVIEYGLCECGCGTTIPRLYKRPSGCRRERRFLPEHILSNYKNSINYKCPICDRGYSDRKSLYRHIDENRCLQKDKMEEFKKDWNKLCECGCGDKLRIGSVTGFLIGHHAWNKGLTKNDDIRLQQNSDRRIEEMQEYPGKSGKWMSHTSIELKVKQFLDSILNKDRYYHQFSFYYKYVVDFAIPDQKLVIECDGNYWHNYPNGVEKDKEENDFIKSKGWYIERFWESEINDNWNFVKERIIDLIDGLDKLPS